MNAAAGRVRLPHTGFLVPGIRLLATDLHRDPHESDALLVATLRLDGAPVGDLTIYRSSARMRWLLHDHARFAPADLRAYTDSSREPDGGALSTETVLMALAAEAVDDAYVRDCARHGLEALRLVRRVNSYRHAYVTVRMAGIAPTSAVGLLTPADTWWQSWAHGRWHDLTPRPAC